MKTILEARIIFDNFEYRSFPVDKLKDLGLNYYSLRHMKLFGIVYSQNNGHHYRFVKDPYQIND
jgi:hypothetical protein